MNADLPGATPAALRRLAEAGPALVEAIDGTTNALSLPDPHVFAPLYGPGSAARFRAHAQGLATVRILELELDVDSDGDLERLGARLGSRTRALPRRPGVKVVLLLLAVAAELASHVDSPPSWRPAS